MKKYIISIFLLFLLLPVICTVYAQNDTSTSVSTGIAKPIYPGDYQQGAFLGQNHAYSVVFRGNGEAVINARIVVANSTDKPLKELILRIPNVTATGIYAFQIFKERQCVRYGEILMDPLTGRYPPATCAEYQDPDYYNDYSYYNAKYKKAEYEYKNDSLTLEIPEPIAVNKAGAFFVYFRASGYTKKDAYGAYDYVFESLQAEDSVRNLNIGISTDSDLFMKDVKGEVNYRFQDVSPSIAKLGGGGGEMGIASSALDSYISSIGQGSIYKSASNLAPLESYKVEGSYANSRVKLYGKEIVIGLLVVLGLLALFVIVMMIIIRLLKKPTNSTKKEVKEDKEVQEKPKNVEIISNGRMFTVVTLIGFIVSLLITLYTVLVVALGTIISSSISYQLQGLITLVLVIISILVYLLLIVTPGIFLGIKKGVGWGIGVVVSTVLWLTFWVVIIIVAVLIFGGNERIINIVPQPLLKTEL